MKKILTGLYHLLWYTVAVLLILAAIIVTAVRLALPGIGGYKDEVQSWVSEYMQYPVVIEEIDANWSGWNPNLHLGNIDLYAPGKEDRIARFENASLGIDMLASIWQGEIVPRRLTISGLALDLTRNKDGSLSISNQATGTGNINNSNNGLADWLLNQRYIELEDASVSWKDNREDLPVRSFDKFQIQIRTDGERRQLDASVALPAAYGKSLAINMDITGNPLDTDWRGDVFIEANDIVGDELLRNIPVRARGGAADVNLWTRWEETRLVEASGNVDFNDFVLVAGDEDLAVESLLAHFAAERHGKRDWLLKLGLEDVKTTNGLWPTSSHELQLIQGETDGHYLLTARSSFLRLQEILPSLIASGLLPETWLAELDWPSLQGDMRNITLHADSMDVADSLRFEADFVDVGIASADKRHSVSGLDGHVQLDGDTVQLQMNSEQTQLSIAKLFERELPLQQLKANVLVQLSTIPTLQVRELSLTSMDTPIELSGEIRFQEASPFIDLIGRIGKTRLENLPAYLPRQTDERLQKWFNQAFVGGDILSGDLLFRGTLNQYPFNEDEGIFQALLNVSNATLNYQEGWPYVDNLTAEIIVNNDDLSISSASGYVFDASIDKLNARIDDLVKGDHHVIVDGALSGQTENALLFINQSPLQKNTALREFASMNMAGGFGLNLQLDIPLGEGKTAVDGRILFDNTLLESNMPGLGLENINGEIKFNRDTAWGSNIDAYYQGKPVTLTIPFDDDDDGRSEFIVSGRADKVFIIQQLGSFFPTLLSSPHNFFDYFDGESRWSVTIERQRDDSNRVRRNILIESSLAGIDVHLPPPLGKPAATKSPLTIKTSMTENRIEQIVIGYDDLLTSTLKVDNRADFSIDSIRVDLGETFNTRHSNADISINGALPELNLDEWIDFVNTQNMQSTPRERGQPSRTVSMELMIDELLLLDHPFYNTRFNLNRKQDDWLATFDGTGIQGQVRLIDRNTASNDKLVAEMKNLTFLETEASKGNNKQYDLDLNTLPELQVNIEDFVYHGSELGQASLSTSNEQDLIIIDSLAFTKPGVDIKGTGQWKKSGGINRSAFDITIDAATLAGLLDTFSHEGANIEQAETRIAITANWIDSPINFDMGKVFGQVSIDIGKGQLLDLDPSAGRLLGLLSVTTLPRRLSLDFSDLFKKGFAFDGIEGSFSLQNGEAYTNNLFMTAPAADISVSGRTGLVAEDYDQIATVMPKITSSLPVASALFGPIGVGVGTAIFLAGEVFESIPRQINKILSYQYSIQGSWDDPDIEKIDKETPSS